MKDTFLNTRGLKKYLNIHTSTRFMAAVILDIPIQNVCRYVDMLRDDFSIAIVKMDYCKISGHKAEYLTTDPDKFPFDNQLKMFDDGMDE